MPPAKGTDAFEKAFGVLVKHLRESFKNKAFIRFDGLHYRLMKLIFTA
jgi:hypothetical protein